MYDVLMTYVSDNRQLHFYRQLGGKEVTHLVWFVFSPHRGSGFFWGLRSAGMLLKRRLFAWLCVPMMMKNRSMLIPKIDMQLPAAICSANECFGDAGLEGNLS